MRIATWNIRAGGGRRIEPIANAILTQNLDVLIVTEFREVAGRALLSRLETQGYQLVTGNGHGVRNCVGVISRVPCDLVGCVELPKSAHRWSCVHFPRQDLQILGVHVPNQTEIWDKRDFWNAVITYGREIGDGQAVITGDLNTALDEDCEGDPIREALYLKEMAALGWVDAWRLLNPDAREFSWYSHRANGFRLDHCLISPVLRSQVVACRYVHDVRLDRLSDHSMMVTELASPDPGKIDAATVKKFL